MQNRKLDDEIIARVVALEKGQLEVKKSIDDNTMMTKQIQDNTNELIELFNASKSVIKTAHWLSRAFKYVAGLVVAGIALYAAIKSFLGQQ